MGTGRSAKQASLNYLYPLFFERLVIDMKEPSVKKPSFIERLTEDQLEKLSALGQPMTFSKNSFVFHKGDPGDNVYLLRQGRIAVITFSADGREMFLNILEAGEAFGEIAAIDGMPRTASAQAIADSDLVMITRDNFLNFLQTHPLLCIKLLEMLCQRLRWANSQVENTIFLTAPLRLARALANLGKIHGIPHPLGIKIGLYLPQDRLANLIGVTRESTNKFLKQLERKGFIYCIKREIIIHDMHKLETVTDEHF